MTENESTDSSNVAPNSLLRSVAVVIGSTVITGLAGLGIGLGLGTYVPGYYRTVFRGGDQPGFDPVAVGIGQGLTQGVVLGAVLGLCIVAIHQWRQSRIDRLHAPTAQGDSVATVSGRPTGWWLVGIVVLTGSCAALPALGVGCLYGYISSDTARGNRDVHQVRLILDEHPDRFGSLSINRGPVDKFMVEGMVETQDDLDFLREELVQTFGEERADFVLAVEVRQQ